MTHISFKTKRNQTPLHFVALRNDKVDAVKVASWLIKDGARLNDRDISGNTVLHLAARTLLEELKVPKLEPKQVQEFLSNRNMVWIRFLLYFFPFLRVNVTEYFLACGHIALLLLHCIHALTIVVVTFFFSELRISCEYVWRFFAKPSIYLLLVDRGCRSGHGK